MLLFFAGPVAIVARSSWLIVYRRFVGGVDFFRQMFDFNVDLHVEVVRTLALTLNEITLTVLTRIKEAIHREDGRRITVATVAPLSRRS
jgi:hypothetical protein